MAPEHTMTSRRADTTTRGPPEISASTMTPTARGVPLSSENCKEVTITLGQIVRLRIRDFAS